jgi:ketosteroid isomerase-like protein
VRPEVGAAELTGADQLRAVVAAFGRARDAHDGDAVRALLADDVVHVMPASFAPEPVVGAAAVATGLTSGMGRYFDVDSVRRETTRVTLGDELAVVEQRMTSQTRDGRPFANSYVWIFEFRSGKISRLTEHADTLRAARTFGMVS